jgi:hypothetical protein
VISAVGLVEGSEDGSLDLLKHGIGGLEELCWWEATPPASEVDVRVRVITRECRRDESSAMLGAHKDSTQGELSEVCGSRRYAQGLDINYAFGGG